MTRTCEVYHLSCWACDHEFETPAPPANQKAVIECPGCGQELVIEWREAHE